MTLKLKSGGVWQTVVDGRMRVKSGGVWKAPAYVKVKSGEDWKDTGYLGHPNPPQGIWVKSWDFSTVSVQWGTPADGGPAVGSYEVWQTYAGGSEVPGSRQTTAVPWSNNFAVSADAKYQFFVRSIGAVGSPTVLTSPTVGPLKVQIGHPEVGSWPLEDRTRPWSSGHDSGGRNDAQPFQVYVPNTVTIQGMHGRNLHSVIADYQYGILSPVPDRTVNWVFNSAAAYPIDQDYGGVIWNGSNFDRGLYNNGANQYWGIIPLGAGWANAPAGTYNDWARMLWCDDLWCDGFETYQVAVYRVVVPYQANSYW